MRRMDFSIGELSNIAAYENDLRCADCRHPVDFIEPADENGCSAPSDLVCALVWCEAGESLTCVGVRLVTVIHLNRPDLIDEHRYAAYVFVSQLLWETISEIRSDSVGLLRELRDFRSEALVWAIQAPHIDDIGFRALLMLHALKEGERGGDSMEQVAATGGVSKQRAHWLQMGFRRLFDGRRK